jgi:hypothetical protein
MGDNESTRPATLVAEVAKRTVTALSARALWAVIVYLLHRDM